MVLHRQHSPAPIPSYLHEDFAACGAVLDRVGDDVVEHPLESLWVPLADRSTLGSLEPKRMILRGLLVVGDHLLCKGREVRRASPKLNLKPRLKMDRVQQFVDERCHSFCRTIDGCLLYTSP